MPNTKPPNTSTNMEKNLPMSYRMRMKIVISTQLVTTKLIIDRYSYGNHSAKSDLKRADALASGQPKVELGERDDDGERVERLGEIDRIERRPVEAIVVEPIEGLVGVLLRVQIALVHVRHMLPEGVRVDRVLFALHAQERVVLEAERAGEQDAHEECDDVAPRRYVVLHAQVDALLGLAHIHTEQPDAHGHVDGAQLTLAHGEVGEREAVAVVLVARVRRVVLVVVGELGGEALTAELVDGKHEARYEHHDDERDVGYGVREELYVGQTHELARLQ